jgi:D-alanyl-lipoteichoic acid acyltransferase DltB (MBOAT superfamily)
VLFNSLPFLVFFPLFAGAYFATRGRTRLLVCLAGSYLFYGWWDWRFLGLIALSTGVDFLVGLRLERARNGLARRHWLVLSMVVNLGALATFKYFNFFIESFVEVSAAFGVDIAPSRLSVILPVGISFYTFQTLSYTLDVYWRKIDCETDLLRFATFVAFFPQLVAGPIVRAGHLLPQLHRDAAPSWDRFVDGLGLVLWGFFKKVAVADSLAALVDGRFADPSLHSSLSLSIGVVFYAFQIYCDFSGYSDIAIGLGRILGIDLGENFKTPYFSQSFAEFWRRWHISLSTWLRDYLYIPLGGNRGSPLLTYRNLALTMLLGGLWHGASWNFVIWGGLHGIYLAAERMIRGERAAERSGGVIGLGRVALVFGLTCFAWIFFRAESLGDALLIIERIGSLDGVGFGQKFLIARAGLLLTLLLSCELAVRRPLVRSWLERRGSRVFLYAACILLIALFGTFDGSQFIYFQF